MENKHYIIPIFVSHEGCPHNCIFCDQTIITGNKQEVDVNFVRRTIENHLKTIKRSTSKVEVSFFGGTFTAIPIDKQRELLKVAKEYKDKRDIDYIRLSTRPDYIDSCILDNLKEYSVDIIELGIQSLDREVLFKSGRGHSKEDVKRASYLIKKYGFVLGHQIMVGLPCDTFEKDIETVKNSISMKPDIYRIYPALVIKGTVMEDMYKRKQYKPYELSEAVDICKILYCILRANKIKVIRIGLQPTENINLGKDVIAGPFHPAFRELVEGRIYNHIIEENIPLSYKGEITIGINNRDLSKLYANKKEYFNHMKEKFIHCSIKVVQDFLMNRETLNIIGGNFNEYIELDDYIINNYKNF
ncbi:elongator complex protein 3 [Clostridium sp. BJN0013]|uniref:elongator complex protein 3 n=1 Tax=Clostridium sp. BJN0013 TaxID=3236840 RepID=UPI0034C69B62